MKNIILAFFLLVFCSACAQVEPTMDAVSIAGDVVVVSDEVDDVQEIISEYVDEGRMKELDALQTEISKALSGDINSTRLEEIHVESVALYSLIADDIYVRWNEISKPEQLVLTKINEHLEMLNRKIATFLNDPSRAKTLSFGKNVLDFVYYSKKVVEIVSDTEGEK